MCKEIFSYETYGSVAEGMKISFTMLANEECDKCKKFEQYNAIYTKDISSPECDTCEEWSPQKKNLEEARILYSHHRQKSASASDTAFYSADLQKLIILPWLHAFKFFMFTRRIIAFNENLSPPGSTKYPNRPFSDLWSEPVSGR